MRAATPEELLAAPQLWAAADIPFLPVLAGREDLGLYLQMLLKWNKVLNLTGSAGALPLLRDLIQDSFFLLQFLDQLATDLAWQEPLLADLGAGAGLPGIPLRLFWQKGSYNLVELRQQRAIFLQNVIARLKLKNTHVRAISAENYFAGQSAKAQCILSRAFRPWPQVLALAKPWLAANGAALLMANEKAPTLPPGWALAKEISYQLPHKQRWLWAARPDYEN